jgi:hypothetical protein
MTIRPFDWRDFPALQRYRNQSVYLDTALVLTRGPMLISGALLSFLAPQSGIITSICSGKEDCGQTLIGQMIHSPGAQAAHMTFVAPDEALDSPAFPALLDDFMVTSGERGAFRLMAEVDDRSMAFEGLRQSGFAIYSRQRVWQLTSQPAGERGPNCWRVANGEDVIPVRSLYNNLVPGLVQQVEPFSASRPQGLVYYQGDNLVAFIELKYGHRGIWGQPFVHPDALDVPERFADLVQQLPYRGSRPLYLCVRSYQSWLEPAIEDLGAEVGLLQAVMVKYLAIPQKAARMFALPAIEGGHPEISAPMGMVSGLPVEKDAIFISTFKENGE